MAKRNGCAQRKSFKAGRRRVSFVSRANCPGHKPKWSHPSAAQKAQRRAFATAARRCHRRRGNKPGSKALGKCIRAALR